jgi:hypothetical protein
MANALVTAAPMCSRLAVRPRQAKCLVHATCSPMLPLLGDSIEHTGSRLERLADAGQRACLCCRPVNLLADATPPLLCR